MLDAGDDGVEVPAQAAVVFAGLVGETVDEVDGGVVIVPAEKGDAATFRAEVDGDGGFIVLGGGWNQIPLPGTTLHCCTSEGVCPG